MLFSCLSGRIIDRFGYTPVFIGYEIFPLIGTSRILKFVGKLEPDARFARLRQGNAHGCCAENLQS